MANLFGRVAQLERAMGGNGPLLVFVGDGATADQAQQMADALACGRVVVPVNSLDERL